MGEYDTNLAALKMRLRDIEGADRTATEARERLATAAHSEEEQDVRHLVISVLTETARRQGRRHEDADRLLDDLERAVRRLVALLGGEHPQSLSALVALATAEFESARAAGDRDRMQRAAHVLAVASQKAAATMGAHHPQSVAALLSLAAVEGEAAREARGDRGIDEVRALLTEAARRWGVMRRGADYAPRAAIPAPEPQGIGYASFGDLRRSPSPTRPSSGIGHWAMATRARRRCVSACSVRFGRGAGRSP
ncbi:hypothetical protein [Streptomyces sp. NPDC002187]|uniref:hypothetical protein n=1 Tax=Streptomyces sp. NPDC002187 TaxID=3364637 RepID=UPI0036D192B1